MAKEKFPQGGMVNESNDAGDAPESIIPLDKLPGLLKTNPVADVIKSIRDLPQVDRLVLYNRLDVIMNHDREKASAGTDGGTHLFDEAIKSL